MADLPREKTPMLNNFLDERNNMTATFIQIQSKNLPTSDQHAKWKVLKKEGHTDRIDDGTAVDTHLEFFPTERLHHRAHSLIANKYTGRFCPDDEWTTKHTTQSRVASHWWDVPETRTLAHLTGTHYMFGEDENGPRTFFDRENLHTTAKADFAWSIQRMHQELTCQEEKPEDSQPNRYVWATSVQRCKSYKWYQGEDFPSGMLRHFLWGDKGY